MSVLCPVWFCVTLVIKLEKKSERISEFRLHEGIKLQLNLNFQMDGIVMQIRRKSVR
jgi:hypothetical protein